ncbi:MAG: hypothetical protein HZB47_01390 [Nitrosomonadales bacterium]|nr:hypothetical protein [Nitrosomonadales bacterium]
MKLAAGVMLLGAMLAGSAQAAATGAPAAPSLSEDSTVQAAPPTARRNKAVRNKKANPADKKVGAELTDQNAKSKRETLTETPPAAAEESVRVRGVRG